MLVALFLSGGRTQDEVTVETGEEYTKVLFAMGTYITMAAYGEPAESFLELSEKSLHLTWQKRQMVLLIRRFPSYYIMGVINGEHHIPSEKDLTELLRYVDYKRVILDENVVTPPYGMQLELEAAGKGYTDDIISELLKEKGVTSALLNIGGNIQTTVKKPDGSDWRLGLKNPENGGLLCMEIEK